MKYLKLIPFVIVLLVSSCTIVRHDESDNKSEDVQIYFDNSEFDAGSYVNDLWETKIIPTIKEKAVDTNELLELLESDEKRAKSGDWAVQQDITAPVNFMISGEGEITAVNLESAASTIDIKMKEKTVTMQIGPVIKYTSIRDSLKFIKFEDFTNQLEYAKVSKEINKKVKENVLAGLDRENLEGKRIRFLGCSTDNHDPLIITPVRVEILSEGELDG